MPVKSLSAKAASAKTVSYVTAGGVCVRRTCRARPYAAGTQALARRLDRHRGVLLSSAAEFPGRYTRWDIGFADPPLAVSGCGRSFRVTALNARGQVLLDPIAAALAALPAVVRLDRAADGLAGEVDRPSARLAEEERSRQPSLFAVLRALTRLFASAEDPHLGLYGAFGYDLVFQFEPQSLSLPRSADQRDLLLYLPDEILVLDHLKQEATLHRYDFAVGGRTTAGLPRRTAPAPYRPRAVRPLTEEGDHAPGDFAAAVAKARAAFARGDLFEVVLSQLFRRSCAEAPSAIFGRLSASNPAPYGALINLGAGEFLVAASPEMFVRVTGRRIETCPISGTIARGHDALGDAQQIRALLNSAKDEAELTMCTDVDRNDKSRVCEPGSVRVIGRRQIELYSRLIHTVDHVEGRLRPEFDAFDGFLSHAWAVTVTGAPKPGALRYIEQEERSPRRWYGGAIGRCTFDGNMNTGLTLRTIRLQDGVAELRAGATLLHDSEPAAEDAECRLKAAALFAVLAPPEAPVLPARPAAAARTRVLLIDHEDSFVHTLAGYCRALGAEVTTLRPALARARLGEGVDCDLVLLSPGPGRPADFAMAETLDLLVPQRRPVFGVCLGLEAIVEYFGGTLAVLPVPAHGKPALVRRCGGMLLAGLPERFEVGRYHSLHAERQSLPPALRVTAETEDGVVMALEHAALPVAGVQFHPESLLTAAETVGLPILAAALALGRAAGTDQARSVA